MSDGRTAICPGTYDPVTNGHLDIIGQGRERVRPRSWSGWSTSRPARRRRCSAPRSASAFIDDAVAQRPRERARSRSSRSCVVELARKHGATAIVKGLRAISDFEYEFEMNQLNRKLAPEIESIYIIASPDYSFLSSTGVKEMATFGGDVSDLVPAGVATALAQRLKR